MTEIGYIRGNDFPGDCDEAFAKIKTWLEESRVYIKTGTINGYIIASSEPSASDRDKLWLKTDSCGARWQFWSTTCGKWCPIGGIPGERVTRHRINETVAEDIEEYYGCGWQLANGENLLSVDLRKIEAQKDGIYQIDLPGQYCLESITVDDGGETEYDGLDEDFYTLGQLVEHINSQPIPVTASNSRGCLMLTADSVTAEIDSATDCAATEVGEHPTAEYRNAGTENGTAGSSRFRVIQLAEDTHGLITHPSEGFSNAFGLQPGIYSVHLEGTATGGNHTVQLETYSGSLLASGTTASSGATSTLTTTLTVASPTSYGLTQYVVADSVLSTAVVQITKLSSLVVCYDLEDYCIDSITTDEDFHSLGGGVVFSSTGEAMAKLNTYFADNDIDITASVSAVGKLRLTLNDKSELTQVKDCDANTIPFTVITAPTDEEEVNNDFFGIESGSDEYSWYTLINTCYCSEPEVDESE